MCGRFRLTRRDQYLRDHYGLVDDDQTWVPRYNIAPTQPVVTVRQRSGEMQPAVVSMRWGLIPNWADDVTVGARMINARSETAATKPAFSDPLRKQRCLIPADGFYEWQKHTGSKQPFCITLRDEVPFAFAGLWDSWLSPNGERIESCTILTTTANSLLADVHDRMPVILPPATYEMWLDPRFSNVSRLADLLKPYAADLMQRFPVSTRVNTVKNDDESICTPVEPPPASGQMQLLLGNE